MSSSLLWRAPPIGQKCNRSARCGARLAEPVNQGVVYNDESSATRAERESAFTTRHCIDVPVPPEVIMGAPLTRQASMGHVGYVIALQYLQQNAAYAQSFPDIGEWECIEHPFTVAGVAGM